MSVQPPNDQPDDRPAKRRRGSFLRSWFDWLVSGFTLADDAAFPLALRPSRSGRRSSLAAAYARQPAQATTARSAPAPTWKVLEPPTSADRVPHEEWRVAACGPDWNLLGASVRGKLHAHQAQWRDDAFAWQQVGDWTCVAVADGAGSAPLSRVGSHLACGEGVRLLATTLAGWHPVGEVTPAGPGPDDLRHLRGVLVEAARQARTSLFGEAALRGRPAADFHTTFLLLIYAPFGDADLVGALQVGDGAIGLYTTERRCIVLGRADHGAYSSETRFLTTPHIEDNLEGRTAFSLQRGLRGVAVLTDGVADDFFPEDRRLVELFDGDPIADLQSAGGGPVRGLFRGLTDDPRDGQALAEWLRYEKRGSSDDRTLVLLHRRQGAGA